MDMNTGNLKLIGLLFGVIMLASGSVQAQTPKVWITAGAKGGVGGNYLSVPDMLIEADGVPFNDGGGGIGGGGGIFGEVRFLQQHLGFEMDLLLDGNKTWCSINDVDFIMKYTQLRIPLLLKGSLVSGITRVSLGIGPEFRVGLNASTDIDPADDVPAIVRDGFKADAVGGVGLAWEFALAFMLSPIEITVDLRFAYNASLEKDFEDRIDRDTRIYEATHSVDGRIMIGVGYVFTAGK
ncbi:MAG: outer membrane beta-barrel protein [Deltaproteobacteria bacterium]|nr:outer membrane beta-barrel protein [Deltaproteobacteria bacterium]